MATPIDSKKLLEQFLEGTAVGEKSKGTFPKIEQQKLAETTPDSEKLKQNLRFSITVPTPLALAIREYVTQATIQRLVQGSNYSISQFFSEAADHYMKKESN